MTIAFRAMMGAAGRQQQGGDPGGDCDSYWVAASQDWATLSINTQAGNEFTVGASNVTACALRFRGASGDTEEVLRLWRVSDQQLLAQVTTSPGDTAEWKEAAITPVELAAGQNYIITRRIADGATRAIHRISAANFDDDVTFDPALTWVQARLQSGTGFPTGTSAFHLYGVDVRFGA